MDFLKFTIFIKNNKIIADNLPDGDIDEEGLKYYFDTLNIEYDDDDIELFINILDNYLVVTDFYSLLDFAKEKGWKGESYRFETKIERNEIKRNEDEDDDDDRFQY